MGGGRGDRLEVAFALLLYHLYSIIDYIGSVWLSALMSFTCYTYTTSMLVQAWSGVLAQLGKDGIGRTGPRWLADNPSSRTAGNRR